MDIEHPAPIKGPLWDIYKHIVEGRIIMHPTTGKRGVVVSYLFHDWATKFAQIYMVRWEDKRAPVQEAGKLVAAGLTDVFANKNWHPPSDEDMRSPLLKVTKKTWSAPSLSPEDDKVPQGGHLLTSSFTGIRDRDDIVQCKRGSSSDCEGEDKDEGESEDGFEGEVEHEQYQSGHLAHTVATGRTGWSKAPPAKQDDEEEASEDVTRIKRKAEVDMAPATARNKRAIINLSSVTLPPQPLSSTDHTSIFSTIRNTVMAVFSPLMGVGRRPSAAVSSHLPAASALPHAAGPSCAPSVPVCAVPSHQLITTPASPHNLIPKPALTPTKLASPRPHILVTVEELEGAGFGGLAAHAATVRKVLGTAAATHSRSVRTPVRKTGTPGKR